MSSPVAGPPPAHESKIYSEFSHLYDRIFTKVFFPRIRSTIASLEIPDGARVLEVGVGTGLSLSAYPRGASVVGIDVSREMLEKAQEKVDAAEWSHIRLEEGDAMSLGFEDRSFDYVMAFHVVSVVPDANRAVDEMLRVCRPGGRIVVINHFRSERRLLARCVDLLDPVTRYFGWRTTLRFGSLFDGHPVEIEQRFKTTPTSLFTVAVARKRPAGLS